MRNLLKLFLFAGVAIVLYEVIGTYMQLPSLAQFISRVAEIADPADEKLISVLPMGVGLFLFFVGGAGLLGRRR